MERYIVALEPGSSKIRAALGSVNEQGMLTIHAVEEERLTDAIGYGIVRNVTDVSRAVSNVLESLEISQGGGKVTGVYVALGGRSLTASPRSAETRLPADTMVTDEHLRSLESRVRQSPAPDREVVDVLPCKYMVDNARVSNPVGAIAQELRADYSVLSCRRQLKSHLNNVLDKTLGLNVNGFVPRQLAQADLVLSTDDKRIGCMLVDMGADTTTVSIYSQGVLVYLATLPLGSRLITRDLTTLTHLEEKAEQIKLTCSPEELTEDMAHLVDARVGEIIANITEQIKYARLSANDLPEGIVLVGGGAKLKTFAKALKDASGMRVRMGQPTARRIIIADTSINPSDAVDVIAVLSSAAALDNCRSCFQEYIETIPSSDHDAVTPAEPVNEPVKVTHNGTRLAANQGPKPVEKPVEAAPEIPTIGNRKGSSLTGLANYIKNVVSKAISETDDDDSDDMKDDI